MNDDLFIKTVDDLPQDFDLDQFTISFIHSFPDVQVSTLWDYPYGEIKHYLSQYVLRQTIENKLKLAHRICRYDKAKKGKVFLWTKNPDKKSVNIQIKQKEQ